MLHRNSQERFEKLKKDFRGLMRNFNRDTLEDFILTANSMPEWIRNDSGMSREQLDALTRFTVPNSLDWMIVRDVANRQKHVKPQRNGKPFVRSVQITSGARGFVNPPRTRILGAGDEIIIECDGRSERALSFVIRTFRHFHYIFEEAPLPLSQRIASSVCDILE